VGYTSLKIFFSDLDIFRLILTFFMFVEVIYEFLQENPFIKKNEPLQVWVQRLRNIWEASRPSFLLSLLQFP